MLSMYAKLFSRIAESSLMEQDVTVRYCFMMLLAVSDMHGDVIGTDVAIARRLNLPLEDFTKAVDALMAEDPDSNSQDQDGKRVIPSESGRGYHIVNYIKYREIKSDEEKRAYMREYMRKRRKSHSSKDVTDVNTGKDSLVRVTHAEEEAESDTESKAVKKERPSGYAVPACFESIEGFSAALAGWIEMRKSKRNPATGRAIQILIDRLSEKPERAIAALDAATECGWSTVKWAWLDNYNRAHGNGTGGLDKSRTCGLEPHEMPMVFDPATGKTSRLGQ